MTDNKQTENNELPEWVRKYLVARERALITELRAIWDMLEVPPKIPKRQR